AKHLHAAGREINDEHRVERHETSPRPHFSRKEICSRDRSPMRAQKRVPRRRARWRWWQTVGLQDAGDRRSSDLVPEVLEGTLNPGVAPRRVSLGHSHDELADLGEDTATARSPVRIRPLARHQLPVPPQQRVRRDDRRDVTQGFSTEPISPYGKSSPVVVGQPQSPHTDLSSDKAILFNEIGHRLPLSAIEPADDSDEQQLEDRDVDHERELISQSGKKLSAFRSILTWDITGPRDGHLPRPAGMSYLM